MFGADGNHAKIAKMRPSSAAPPPRPARPSTGPGPSVAGGFVTGMLAGCARRGIDPAPLLDHAGIARTILADVHARIPLGGYVALYNAVVERLGDEGFALFSQPLRPGSFEFLCRCAISAPDLGQALAHACRFLGLILPDIAARLDRADGEAAIVLTETLPLRDGAGRVFAFEWLLRLLHALACWLAGRGLVLDRVDFPYAAPPHVADYDLIYTADSRFGASVLRARFAANLLDLPVRRDEAALRQYLAGGPGRISTLYRRDREMVLRVRDCLRGALPEMLTLAQVADALHVSPRTLHRRLEAENSGFQAIKDALRRDLAVSRLTKSDLPLSRIAADLGFADATAFYRAFVGWTGMAPLRYRQRQRAADAG